MDLETLQRMSLNGLNELFSDTFPGDIPDGPMDGTVLIHGICIDLAVAAVIKRFAWQGKTFNALAGTLTNRIDGLDVIAAHVYFGPSWYDLEDCIVLDYSDANVGIRDELRQVDGNLYLGKAYRTHQQIKDHHALLHFALRKPKSNE